MQPRRASHQGATYSTRETCYSDRQKSAVGRSWPHRHRSRIEAPALANRRPLSRPHPADVPPAVGRGAGAQDAESAAMRVQKTDTGTATADGLPSTSSVSRPAIYVERLPRDCHGVRNRCRSAVFVRASGVRMTTRFCRTDHDAEDHNDLPRENAGDGGSPPPPRHQFHPLQPGYPTGSTGPAALAWGGDDLRGKTATPTPYSTIQMLLIAFARGPATNWARDADFRVRQSPGAGGSYKKLVSLKGGPTAVPSSGRTRCPRD